MSVTMPVDDGSSQIALTMLNSHGSRAAKFAICLHMHSCWKWLAVCLLEVSSNERMDQQSSRHGTGGRYNYRLEWAASHPLPCS